MGELLHWYSEEGPGRAAAPPSPLLAVPNVTAYPSTASVPITVLLHDGPLLCGFNVAIKLLTIDNPSGDNSPGDNALTKIPPGVTPPPPRLGILALTLTPTDLKTGTNPHS